VIAARRRVSQQVNCPEESAEASPTAPPAPGNARDGWAPRASSLLHYGWSAGEFSGRNVKLPKLTSPVRNRVTDLLLNRLKLFSDKKQSPRPKNEFSSIQQTSRAQTSVLLAARKLDETKNGSVTA